jgi:hypothetical protein
VFALGKPFFASLSAEHAGLVLEGLSSLPVIDHGPEGILAYIAETRSAAVWEFLGGRLERAKDVEGEHYEAFLYSFHDLKEPLRRYAESAVASARSWFHGDDPSQDASSDED